MYEFDQILSFRVDVFKNVSFNKNMKEINFNFHFSQITKVSSPKPNHVPNIVVSSWISRFVTEKDPHFSQIIKIRNPKPNHVRNILAFPRISRFATEKDPYSPRRTILVTYHGRQAIFISFDRDLAARVQVFAILRSNNNIYPAEACTELGSSANT